MDASEGQRFLHAKSANEIESDDEHWLWAHVGRIKRSINSVLGNDNEHPNKRIKRGFWDFLDTSETTEEVTTSTTSKPLFNIFDSFGSNNDEKTTAKPTREENSEELNRSQNDVSAEDGNSGTEDDLDVDLPEGSGSNKIDESEDKYSPYCELNSFEIQNNSSTCYEICNLTFNNFQSLFSPFEVQA